MAAPRLECINLHKSFMVGNQTRQVLKGVTLAVGPGETVVIIGRSGAGKSVLLWLMSGIDRPDTGDIIFDGRSLNKLAPGELAELRRSKIGLVFQDFNLIESWTAIENVRAALLNSGLSRSEQEEKSAKLLQQLDLSEHANNLPCQLSIGQQQRVALARALVNQPTLLLADEPCGEVDAETSAQVVALLRDYIRQQNATMVVATHGPFPVQNQDRVLRLKDGVLTPA